MLQMLMDRAFFCAACWFTQVTIWLNSTACHIIAMLPRALEHDLYATMLRRRWRGERLGGAVVAQETHRVHERVAPIPFVTQGEVASSLFFESKEGAMRKCA